MRPCLLFDAPPAFIALFIPHESGRAAAPPGKTRAIAYTLCDSCALRPDKAEAAEAAVVNRLDALKAAARNRRQRPKEEPHGCNDQYRTRLHRQVASEPPSAMRATRRGAGLDGVRGVK
jgi:hypothetical protein